MCLCRDLCIGAAGTRIRGNAKLVSLWKKSVLLGVVGKRLAPVLGWQLDPAAVYQLAANAFSDALASAILKDMICYIAQKSTLEETKQPELVQKIMLCIQQNYDKEISNSQISEKLGYHSFYLNRVFKKHTRMTIHQAVISEKMRIAKKILEETELSVNAIAIEVGYSEHSRFCTAFKKYVGVTPLEYRKKKM